MVFVVSDQEGTWLDASISERHFRVSGLKAKLRRKGLRWFGQVQRTDSRYTGQMVEVEGAR